MLEERGHNFLHLCYRDIYRNIIKLIITKTVSINVHLDCIFHEHFSCAKYEALCRKEIDVILDSNDVAPWAILTREECFILTNSML